MLITIKQTAHVQVSASHIRIRYFIKDKGLPIDYIFAPVKTDTHILYKKLRSSLSTESF